MHKMTTLNEIITFMASGLNHAIFVTQPSFYFNYLASKYLSLIVEKESHFILIPPNDFLARSSGVVAGKGLANMARLLSLFNIAQAWASRIYQMIPRPRWKM